MVTSRFRWLFCFAVVGTLLGLLRGQELLALIGLSLLLWLLGEWLLFRLRFLAVSRLLQCRRTVNRSGAEEATLWSQRPAEIELEVTSRYPLETPVVRLTDYLPEQFALAAEPNTAESNTADAILRRGEPLRIVYRARPRAAGRAELPGVTLQMFDLQGLFFARSFLPCRQRFKVLPMPVPADGPRPHRKSVSALPPPGIHRLQKAGMGGELLDLREYVPGDPPKAIAWKVSARRDCLMIRQHESEVPIRTTLLVDQSAAALWGGFGMRSIDQMVLLAATVAQSSLTVRDPVGMMLIDEEEIHTVRHGGGNRHYFRLLDELAGAASRQSPAKGVLYQGLIDQAYQVAHDRYPELMSREANRVPFFLFPVGPAARYVHRKRVQLAALVTELYALPLASAVKLQVDGEALAKQLHRFLADEGCAIAAWGTTPEKQHLATMENFTQAILRSVSRGRDNEVFVVLADLLDHAGNLGRLTHAVSVAAARHHRVIVICPWPDWLGPRTAPIAPLEQRLSAEQMLYEGERTRLTEAAAALSRTLHRAGASVAFASDPKVTQLVLTQADLVRSGRASVR